MGRKNRQKSVLFGEDFKFLPNEINRKFQKVEKTDAAKLLKLANDSVEKWSSRGFKLFRLMDYKPPTGDNPTIKKLLASKSGDEINGGQLSIAIQSFRKLRDGVYKVSIKSDSSDTTIEEFADRVKEEVFADKFDDPVKFFEHVITRLRRLKTNERLVVYYPGLETSLPVEGEGSFKLNIEDLSSPIKEVLTESYPGFSQGSYMYIALDGAVFALHLDDYEANACNFVLFGNCKLWMIIGKADKLRLRKLLSKRRCDTNHKDLFLDPTFLRKHRIGFTLVKQQAGDLIMVARSTFHQGINFSGDKKIVLATACNSFLSDYFLEFEDFRKEIITCECGHSPIVIPAATLKEMRIKINAIRDRIIHARENRTRESEPEAADDNQDDTVTSNLDSITEQLEFLKNQHAANEHQIQLLKCELEAKNTEMILAMRATSSKIVAMEQEIAGLRDGMTRLQEGVTPQAQGMQRNSSRRNAILVTGDTPVPLENSSDSVTCDQCGKRFANRRNMITHRLMHFQSARATFNCDLCDKTYLSENALKNHKKTIHEGRKFTCICGKSYNQNQKLKLHVTKCATASEDFAG